jgi:hypothetical protein
MCLVFVRGLSFWNGILENSLSAFSIFVSMGFYCYRTFLTVFVEIVKCLKRSTRYMICVMTRLVQFCMCYYVLYTSSSCWCFGHSLTLYENIWGFHSIFYSKWAIMFKRRSSKQCGIYNTHVVNIHASSCKCVCVGNVTLLIYKVMKSCCFS